MASFNYKGTLKTSLHIVNKIKSYFGSHDLYSFSFPNENSYTYTLTCQHLHHIFFLFFLENEAQAKKKREKKEKHTHRSETTHIDRKPSNKPWEDRPKTTRPTRTRASRGRRDRNSSFPIVAQSNPTRADLSGHLKRPTLSYPCCQHEINAKIIQNKLTNIKTKMPFNIKNSKTVGSPASWSESNVPRPESGHSPTITAKSRCYGWGTTGFKPAGRGSDQDVAVMAEDPAILTEEDRIPASWSGIRLFLNFLYAKGHFRLYICKFILNYFSIYFRLTVSTI
jgi:hypothetical protein